MIDTTVTEIVVSEFKPGIDFDEQFRLSSLINKAALNFPGFLSRDVYYTEETKKWIEVINWESKEKASEALKISKTCPICNEVFQQLNGDTMLFMYAESVISFNE